MRSLLPALAVLLLAAPAAARDAIPKDVAVPELVNYLKTGGEDARKEACKRLRDRRDPTTIPAIGEAARKDASMKVRVECIQTLEKMGANAAAAAFVREAAVQDPDRKVREEALDSLQDVDPQGGGDVAAKVLLEDKEYDVRKEACEAIERRGWQAAEPAVAKVVADATEKPELRKACVQSLAAIRTDTAYNLLHKLMLEEPNEDVRREATAEVEHEPRASSLEPLCGALKDRNDRIASNAAKGLKKLGKREGAVCLRAVAKDLKNDRLAGEMNKIAADLER